MNRWTLAALYLFASVAAAQSAAFYDNTLYRKDDPFVFCTQGQQNPDKCWRPIAPYTGGAAWVTSVWCQPVEEYGKPWTQDDYTSLEKYEEICDKAGGQSGGWNPKAGKAELTPTLH